MIIEIDESFKKDFLKIKNYEVKKRILSKIETLEKVNFLEEITNIKKLKGFEKYYRIRIGDYRIGFEYNGEKIILIRVRSRKDIYNIFP
ncbi:MAG: type II toxin-antitoxin system mRNA interferase toxin, RelE/StbE family [Candidatus Gracilibacteria bacterium]|nr:type II toxin-antitoxin system mRNA interferase toxin, RelE/StbE family [Candidatus Gracilibacteria bacterium]